MDGTTCTFLHEVMLFVLFVFIGKGRKWIDVNCQVEGFTLQGRIMNLHVVTCDVSCFMHE
jgi:hypothetical protein